MLIVLYQLLNVIVSHEPKVKCVNLQNLPGWFAVKIVILLRINALDWQIEHLSTILTYEHKSDLIRY